jgi:hypothetical protein
MKKVLAVLACLFISASAYATEIDGNAWETYTVDNTTGEYQVTNISVTELYPGSDRIIGFSVMGYSSSNSENVAAIYDALTTSTNMFGETEAITDSINGMWFPYPRNIDRGVRCVQGANTRVVIYYVRG